MKKKVKKNRTFEQLWQLEQKIFKKDCRSIKKDLKWIYDCRELLIINDTGYGVGCPLEKADRKEIPDKNYGKKNTMYIFSVGIIPEARGKGLGKDLLNKLIAYSPKSRISLDTTSDVMKKMCIEMGFKQITETYFLFIKAT